jgi:uncharacterized membrane protein
MNLLVRRRVLRDRLAGALWVLLRIVMRDRGTQVVLSVFVGAFAYSTAGLYTVGIQRSGQQEFVPPGA